MAYDENDLRSIDYMLTNKSRVGIDYFGTEQSFCPFLDLLPVRNFHITLPNLGSFDTASNLGLTGIIKRAPVSAGFGNLIYTGPSYEPSDGRNVGGLSLKTLYFRLVNSQNRPIDLKTSVSSFSVVFVNAQGD